MTNQAKLQENTCLDLHAVYKQMSQQRVNKSILCPLEMALKSKTSETKVFRIIGLSGGLQWT